VAWLFQIVQCFLYDVQDMGDELMLFQAFLHGQSASSSRIWLLCRRSNAGVSRSVSVAIAYLMTREVSPIVLHTQSHTHTHTYTHTHTHTHTQTRTHTHLEKWSSVAFLNNSHTRLQGLTYADALAQVKAIRSVARPNDGFVQAVGYAGGGSMLLTATPHIPDEAPDK
jgi:hypothetical protein